MRASPRTNDPQVLGGAEGGWIFALPFGDLVGALFTYNMLPETAALYASGAVILLGFAVGYKGHRLTLKDLLRTIVDTASWSWRR